MEKRISVKTLYLIAVIAIGLVVLGVGSTYAIFTAEVNIDNPIYLASTLTYTSDIMETVDVTIEPGETEYIILEVVNSYSSSLNYALWYIDTGEDIDFGVTGEETTTSICPNLTTCTGLASGSTANIGIYIRNNSASLVTVIIGVSGSSGNVVLADDMKIIPNQDMPAITPLSDFTYALGTDSTTIDTINYYDSTTDSYSDVAVNPITISSDEILLIKYNGASSNVYIPNFYIIDDKLYKVVLLSSACIEEDTDGSIDTMAGVFVYNTVITDVSFMKNVKTLSYDYMENDPYTSADYLFYNCSSLVNVNSLPNGIESLTHTFSRCTSLVTSPLLPDTVKTMTTTFYQCTNLLTVRNFPNSLIELDSTFYDCTSLENVSYIPDTVTSMHGTFQRCTNLVSVPNLPESLTVFNLTFGFCSSLESVPDIPSNVTTMVMTFLNATSLTGTINILSSDITSATYVFNNTLAEIILNVPAGSTTFDTISSLTTTTGMPSNVTLIEV